MPAYGHHFTFLQVCMGDQQSSWLPMLTNHNDSRSAPFCLLSHPSHSQLQRIADRAAADWVLCTSQTSTLMRRPRMLDYSMLISGRSPLRLACYSGSQVLQWMPFSAATLHLLPNKAQHLPSLLQLQYLAGCCYCKMIKSNEVCPFKGLARLANNIHHYPDSYWSQAACRHCVNGFA